MSDDGVLVEHTDATEEEVARVLNSSNVSGSDDITPALTTETETSTTSEVVAPHSEAPGPSVTKKVDSATAQDKPIVDDNGPRALQIVSIGSEESAYAFTFHEDALNEVMSQIPPGWKVAVVSVVGAFRTGKSFLLSWFLRYLDHITGKSKVMNKADKNWYETFDSIGTDGFEWRGGSERNTTGIWMWSQPHFVTKNTGSGKEQMAVVLVDSQGMFDNETTMSLTASIFGLSTLLSSYQIYNVDKRIQEDNLQQLALFSEYARLAMDPDEMPIDSGVPNKPFQKIEFLVRDWQHFEDEEDLDVMEQEMTEYLEKVIAERQAKDLQETREQIMACFQSVSCFGLCHPGMKVTKKKFAGAVSEIEDDFLLLLDRYCRRVFSAQNLQPKSIHGRDVTAAELGSYIKAYAQMFAEGASFPQAATMLEATASANNTNAINLALKQYKETMDRIAGPKCSNYIRSNELKEDHEQLREECVKLFNSVAKFGNRKSIQVARESVYREIDESFRVYDSLNTGRNPLAGLEMYAIPLAIGLISFIMRWVADATCSPYASVCRSSSEFLSHVYAVVVFFMVIVFATRAKQAQELFFRAKQAVELMAGHKIKKD